jgi:hypothetical protein
MGVPQADPPEDMEVRRGGWATPQAASKGTPATQGPRRRVACAGRLQAKGLPVDNCAMRRLTSPVVLFAPGKSWMGSPPDSVTQYLADVSQPCHPPTVTTLPNPDSTTHRGGVTAWQNLTDSLPQPADPAEQDDILWQALNAQFRWYERAATRNRVSYQASKWWQWYSVPLSPSWPPPTRPPPSPRGSLPASSYSKASSRCSSSIPIGSPTGPAPRRCAKTPSSTSPSVPLRQRREPA